MPPTELSHFQPRSWRAHIAGIVVVIVVLDDRVRVAGLERDEAFRLQLGVAGWNVVHLPTTG